MWRHTALLFARESADLCCELAKDQPYVYLSDLAMSLYTLAGCLFKQRDPKSMLSALRVVRRAVKSCAWLFVHVSTNVAGEFERAKGRFQAIADECGLQSYHELQQVLAEFDNADPSELLSELCKPLEP